MVNRYEAILENEDVVSSTFNTTKSKFYVVDLTTFRVVTSGHESSSSSGLAAKVAAALNAYDGGPI